MAVGADKENVVHTTSLHLDKIMDGGRSWGGSEEEQMLECGRSFGSKGGVRKTLMTVLTVRRMDDLPGSPVWELLEKVSGESLATASASRMGESPMSGLAGVVLKVEQPESSVSARNPRESEAGCLCALMVRNKVSQEGHLGLPQAATWKTRTTSETASWHEGHSLGSSPDFWAPGPVAAFRILAAGCPPLF